MYIQVLFLTHLAGEKDLFMASLICNVGSAVRLLQYNDDMPSNKKIDFPSASTSVVTVGISNSSAVVPCKYVPSGKETPTEGTGVSPVPSVDTFIQTQIHRGGVQGEIRSWLYFPTSHLIIYNIAKNRYCENIGRQHKSNHVFYGT